MKKRSLISQVIPSFLLVAVIAIVAVASYATVLISRFYHDQARAELTSAARILSEHFRTTLTAGHDENSAAGRQIDVFCKASGKGAGYRMTFVLPDGRVSGDSEENPANMENHADRPEIRDAVIKGVGVSTRYSRTLGKRMMYVAVSVAGDMGQTIGIVRTSLSLSVIDETIALLWHRIAIACLVVAVV
ncbi:MAG: PAS domain-containing sensor histidine kinase, partial [Phycisphaerae bacterium]|nr:PAS domain-containing sensor histidine kinase [Phycisphaerae bacterium]